MGVQSICHSGDNVVTIDQIYQEILPNPEFMRFRENMRQNIKLNT